jgi:hypothetical protein
VSTAQDDALSLYPRPKRCVVLQLVAHTDAVAHVAGIATSVSHDWVNSEMLKTSTIAAKDLHPAHVPRRSH